MNATLFAASRVSALILAVAVAVHLVVIIHAVQQGLTIGAILSRTHGNWAFLVLYGCFVLAAAVHAPIGLRTVLAEWFSWSGPLADWLLLAFGVLLAVLGLRAALAVFLA
ncbi:MAG: succinate dehydrogenase [Rhodospirillales bacterium]|nr:succinate dehydrogenase [Rhodospirillales bacterium]